MIHQKHTCISYDNVLIVILLDLICGWNSHRSINWGMRSLRNEHSNQSHWQDYMIFWKIKRCKDYNSFEILFYECWFTVISFCDNCHMDASLWLCESYSNFFGTACCLFILDFEFSFDMYLKYILRFTRVHFRN